MRDEARLAPEVLERVERSVRDRASRPMPSLKTGDGCEETLRCREREAKLIGSAKLGLVPMLIDGEEWFKHKGEIFFEDLSLMADWHEVEAEAWEEEAERARLVEDVLRGLGGIQPIRTGVSETYGRPGIRTGIAWIFELLKRAFFR